MPHGHVGDFFADQSKVGDDFVERLPLLGVSNGVVERDASAAHAHGAQLEAADVENIEGDDVALADFAQQIFDRNLAVIENDGAGGRAANAHLVLFGAHRKSGESLFHQERGKFLAINFRKHGEQVGEAGVGDPHLFAVEDVVLAIGRKRGAGATVERIGPRRSFGQSVGADDFSGGQARQVFFLLFFGAEIDDGQRADAGVASPGGREAGVFRDVVGDDGGGDFIHFEAAVGFGNFNRAEAELSGFFQQIAGDREVFVFDLLDVGQNLVGRELFRRLRDELMLLGEVFGGEDLRGLTLFQQETAAGNLGIRNCGGSH